MVVGTAVQPPDPPLQLRRVMEMGLRSLQFVYEVRDCFHVEEDGTVSSTNNRADLGYLPRSSGDVDDHGDGAVLSAGAYRGGSRPRVIVSITDVDPTTICDKSSNDQNVGVTILLPSEERQPAAAFFS